MCDILSLTEIGHRQDKIFGKKLVMPNYPTVFVSHSNLDGDWCRSFVAALQGIGFDVWYDEKRLQAGDAWVKVIETELQTRDLFVLVLTPAAWESVWVQDELQLALTTRRRIIVVEHLATQASGFILTRQWSKVIGQDAKVAAQQMTGDLASIPNARDSTSNLGEPDNSQSTISDQSGEILDDNNATHDELEDRFDRAEMARAEWLRDASVFLEDRLAEAFPGVRGLQTYQGQDALVRLKTLLKSPLTIARHHANTPLWWWRGSSNMYFDTFRVLDENRLWCLMSGYEFLINSVVVFRTLKSYRSFVYVSVDADKPTGVYPITSTWIEEHVRQYGYCEECVGYWNGHYVKGEEYDDGYAEIDGKSVRISGAERRRRYLSRYNFFISTQASVFSTGRNDQLIDRICRDLLENRLTLEHAASTLEKIPFSDRLSSLFPLID